MAGFAGAARGAVHCPQNLKSGGFSKRHLGHTSASALVHCPQNLIPSGFSKPHFEQRIFFPRRLVRQFLEQRLGVLEIGGVEAFGEPVVDIGEHRACLVGLALLFE